MNKRYEAALSDWIMPYITGAKNGINRSLAKDGYAELDHGSPQWNMYKRNGFYVIWVEKNEA